MSKRGPKSYSHLPGRRPRRSELRDHLSLCPTICVPKTFSDCKTMQGESSHFFEILKLPFKNESYVEITFRETNVNDSVVKNLCTQSYSQVSHRLKKIFRNRKKSRKIFRNQRVEKFFVRIGTRKREPGMKNGIDSK